MRPGGFAQKFTLEIFQKISYARTTRLRRTLEPHSSVMAPRPPRPVPTFVTMADAPLAGQHSDILVLICPTG